MTSEARMIGYDLLKTGTLVSFRVDTEEVLDAPTDGAEFGLRLHLKFIPHEEEEASEDDVAEDTAEWGAFGFMFALGVLWFAEAKPPNLSELDYDRMTNSSLRISSRVCASCAASCTLTPTTFADAGSKPTLWCAPTERSCSKQSVAARRRCAGSIS